MCGVIVRAAQSLLFWQFISRHQNSLSHPSSSGQLVLAAITNTFDALGFTLRQHDWIDSISGETLIKFPDTFQLADFHGLNGLGLSTQGCQGEKTNKQSVHEPSS